MAIAYCPNPANPDLSRTLAAVFAVSRLLFSPPILVSARSLITLAALLYFSLSAVLPACAYSFVLFFFCPLAFHSFLSSSFIVAARLGPCPASSAFLWQSMHRATLMVSTRNWNPNLRRPSYFGSAVFNGSFFELMFFLCVCCWSVSDIVSDICEWYFWRRSKFELITMIVSVQWTAAKKIREKNLENFVKFVFLH